MSVPCLRLETIGRYGEEEDEFEAKTYFAHSPETAEGEEKKVVSRPIKREFGFLYLRALRTGSRALSLERDSLLDVILRTKGIRTTLWEKTIANLRAMDVEKDAAEIAPVLRDIETRLSRYIALDAPGNRWPPALLCANACKPQPSVRAVLRTQCRILTWYLRKKSWRFSLH